MNCAAEAPRIGALNNRAVRAAASRTAKKTKFHSNVSDRLRRLTMSNTIEFFAPGSPEYLSATTPDNSSATERPAFVVRPTTAAEVGLAVIEAARRGLEIVPQSTGHGAGGTIGDDTVICDTSALTELVIDPERRTASAGAGLKWGEINAAAEKHGLLGLAGTSPTVSICGYTFGGGYGWLTRPHGAASSALLSVEYVDGAGTVRLATEDAADKVDRDALWAFRGAGGVGIATRLEFELAEVPDLHAGYFLWPASELEKVVAAWESALPLVADSVATSISILHTPPAPSFPENLRGVPVVHLAVASSEGEAGALPLLDAVRAASHPGVDTWGAADAAKLGTIHLDPPTAVPALGDARWLGEQTPAIAHSILSVAAEPETPLALVEIRSFGNTAPTRPGAVTSVLGPYAVHAVGALVPTSSRERIQAAFDKVRQTARTVDLGRSLGSWAEGSESVPDALTAEDRGRLSQIADAVDPERNIHRSRFLA